MILPLVIVGAVVIFNLCCPPYNYKYYDSSDQVIELLEKNKEEFNEVMRIIDETKVFTKLLCDESETKCSNSWYIKKYVAKDDYEIIKDFWDAYQPYYMGHGWMSFLIKERPSVQLFYNMDSAENYYSQYGTIMHIDNEWCILEYNE